MMLPDSWKREITESVEEATNADREQRKAQQNNAATEISAAIESLRNAQNTQTDHEDRYENINITLSAVTIFLVFLTVIFTGLSWLAFRDQLHVFSEQLDEMKKAYGPIESQSKAATDAANTASATLVAANRAWLAIRNIQLEEDLIVGQPVKFEVWYENIGKHPALNIKANVVTKPIEGAAVENGPNTFPVGINSTCNGLTTSEGAPAAFPLNGQHYRLKNKTSFNVDTETRNGPRTFYAQGCIAYDSFDYVHYSWFCAYLSPFYGENPPARRVFGLCADGNGAN